MKMELELIRTYRDKGVNGVLNQIENGKPQFICNTIELPWKGNFRRISCIPEGKYELTKRYSLRFGWHLLVNNVPGRSYILIHAYNDAVKESKGCISPVSQVTGEGKGIFSRAALKKLLALTDQEFRKGNQVYLTIKEA